MHRRSGLAARSKLIRIYGSRSRSWRRCNEDETTCTPACRARRGQAPGAGRLGCPPPGESMCVNVVWWSANQRSRYILHFLREGTDYNSVQGYISVYKMKVGQTQNSICGQNGNCCERNRFCKNHFVTKLFLLQFSFYFVTKWMF